MGTKRLGCGAGVLLRGWIDRRVIRHQALIPGSVLARQHHRLAHPRTLAQPRLDLSQLDPEAAELHLKVVATQVLDIPIRPPPTQIPRPVHPRVRSRAEGVLQKTLRCQLRSIEISACDSHASNVDLTRHPHRYRRPLAVQDINLRVRDRPAYRNATETLLGLTLPRGDINSRFRRSIQIG